MYPPHHYGGYELSCRDVMDRWRERGHHITVLTTTMRVAGVEDPPDDGAKGVHRDLTFYWEDHVLQSPPVWERLRIERRNQHALQRAIDAAQPEVVSVWNMGAMSFGLLTTLVERDLPMVLNVCDEWPCYGPRLDAWARLFTHRRAAGRAVRAVTRVPTLVPDVGAHAVTCFVSEAMRQKAKSASAWTYPVSDVVYSGIETREFPVPTGVIAARPWRWRLLYVGRIDDRKGIDEIIRALPDLPDEATLDLVGNGDAAHLAELRALVHDLGLDGRVRFGPLPRAELAARYAASDVFLFPSTWSEPFGLVPLEAMACDTPVIATGTGGTGEFLRDGENAVFFEPGVAGSLAAAIRRLADDEQLRTHLVLAGRRTAGELTIDRLADLLEEWHVAAAARLRDGMPTSRSLP
jgi:glycosyltransferase involved in cell wall biosynthesis